MGFRSIYDKRRKRPDSSRELPDMTPAEIDLDALASDATRRGALAVLEAQKDD